VARRNRRRDVVAVASVYCRASSQRPQVDFSGARRELREIAHSRTGDKGNTSNISVIAYQAKHYRCCLRRSPANG